MDKPILHVACDSPECWPALPYQSWKDTCATLHMWTQIVGKVRMAVSPLINHWWNVTLYPSARGLTTSVMPWEKRTFELEFDFLDHVLVLRASDGLVRTLPLSPRSVAEFYKDTMELLRSAGIDVKIWEMPVEIPSPIAFDQDRVHASYDPEYARRFWTVLTSVHRVFTEFRGRFIGKCSPVHFFWGSFDLAVSRFSGRRAPERKGADIITREAYSQEVSSVGFWPGGEQQDAAFYSYTAPEPEGFRSAAVRPAGASYSPQLGEFLLSYEDVRRAQSPGAALLDFCQSTYEAGANAARWNREALERK